jgi:hypothetical protein
MTSARLRRQPRSLPSDRLAQDSVNSIPPSKLVIANPHIILVNDSVNQDT